MYKDMSPGTKRSMTLSVKRCFSEYMNKIKWNEDQYDSNDFIQYWLEYSRNKASWFPRVEEKLNQSEAFQKELTDKVNSIIQQIFETPPTDDQMEKIERLANEKKVKEPDYCCKLEAEQVIESLSAK